MLTKTEINKIDSHQMYQIYDSWHDLAKQNFENKLKKFEKKDIEHVVFAGMGGSGTVGDIISYSLLNFLRYVANLPLPPDISNFFIHFPYNNLTNNLSFHLT